MHSDLGLGGGGGGSWASERFEFVFFFSKGFLRGFGSVRVGWVLLGCFGGFWSSGSGRPGKTSHKNECPEVFNPKP